MSDECVLCRMISIGLYNNDETKNNLGSQQAMMHRVVMGEWLWELIRVEQEWVWNLACSSVWPLIPSSRKIARRESWGMSKDSFCPSPERLTHFWRSWRSNQRPWGLALTSRTPSSGITWLNSCRPWMNPLFQVGSPLFWIHDLMGWPNNLEWSGLGSGATTMWNINSLPSLGLFVGII